MIVSVVYFRQGPNTTYIYCFSWLPLKRFKILLWSFTSIFVHFKLILYVLTLRQQTWQFHSYANFVTWYFCFPGDETLHVFSKKRTEPTLIFFFTAGVLRKKVTNIWWKNGRHFNDFVALITQILFSSINNTETRTNLIIE